MNFLKWLIKTFFFQRSYSQTNDNNLIELKCLINSLYDKTFKFSLWQNIWEFKFIFLKGKIFSQSLLSFLIRDSSLLNKW
jgi:hypothetical protein